MIDFRTLIGVACGGKVVSQIEDAWGRVLWAMSTGDDEPAAIFEVAKRTRSSYDGETVYEDNDFILLDIYPKPYGTVKVTYGGLTRTVTDSTGVDSPNAQQVCFGRFSGQTYDDVTPASGRLTIEGAYRGYGMGSFNLKNTTTGKANSTYAPCITRVINYGNPSYIGAYAFSTCSTFDPVKLPDGLTHIGSYAFYNSPTIDITEFPEGLQIIESNAFYQPTSSGMAMLDKQVIFPSTLQEVGANAFRSESYYDLGGEKNYRTYLHTAVMRATTPPVLGDCAFGHYFYTLAHTGNGLSASGNRIIIVVPKGSVDAYKAGEGWISNTDNITEAT